MWVNVVTIINIMVNVYTAAKKELLLLCRETERDRDTARDNIYIVYIYSIYIYTIYMRIKCCSLLVLYNYIALF